MKQIIIVCLIMTSILSAPPTANQLCSAGMFKIGSTYNDCKGRFAGNDVGAAFSSTINGNSFWTTDNTIAWTFDVKQDNSSPGGSYEGANTVGLEWTKIANNSYTVSLKKGLGQNTSLAIVLKAANGYSVYRFNCVKSTIGTFDTIGVNAGGNDLSHMSVWVGRDNKCNPPVVTPPVVTPPVVTPPVVTPPVVTPPVVTPPVVTPPVVTPPVVTPPVVTPPVVTTPVVTPPVVTPPVVTPPVVTPPVVTPPVVTPPVVTPPVVTPPVVTPPVVTPPVVTPPVVTPPVVTPQS